MHDSSISDFERHHSVLFFSNNFLLSDDDTGANADEDIQLMIVKTTHDNHHIMQVQMDGRQCSTEHCEVLINT